MVDIVVVITLDTDWDDTQPDLDYTAHTHLPITVEITITL